MRAAVLVLLAACGSPPVAAPAPIESTAPAVGGVCQDPEVHVFAVYQAERPGQPPGAAKVRIDRPGRHVVVLSAYNPVRWTVEAGEDVELVEVLAYGYDPPIVDAPGVRSQVFTEFDSSDEIQLAYALVSDVEQRTHRALTSYQGCYDAWSFRLRDDLSVDVECDYDGGYLLQRYVASGCEGSQQQLERGSHDAHPRLCLDGECRTSSEREARPFP